MGGDHALELVAARLAGPVRRLGGLYLAFTFGFLLAAHAVTTMPEGRVPERVLVEAVVLWLTVGLPPYMVLHGLLTTARLLRQRRDRRHPHRRRWLARGGDRA